MADAGQRPSAAASADVPLERNDSQGNNEPYEPKRGKRSKRKAKFICDDIATVPFPTYYPTGYVIHQVPRQAIPPAPAPPENDGIGSNPTLDSEASTALTRLSLITESHTLPKLLTTDYTVPPQILPLCPRIEKE